MKTKTLFTTVKVSTMLILLIMNILLKFVLKILSHVQPHMFCQLYIVLLPAAFVNLSRSSFKIHKNVPLMTSFSYRFLGSKIVLNIFPKVFSVPAKFTMINNNNNN